MAEKKFGSTMQTLDLQSAARTAFANYDLDESNTLEK